MPDQDPTYAEAFAEVLVRGFGLVLFGVGIFIWGWLTFGHFLPASIYPEAAALFAGLLLFGYGFMAMSRIAAALFVLLSASGLAVNAISGFSGTGGRYFAGLAFVWLVIVSSVGAAWRRLR